MNAAIYAREKGYLSGGRWFAQGLFDWEKKAMEHPAFPRQGRLLLGGAGGGRELHALLKLGYRVTAFDPCKAMLPSLQSCVQKVASAVGPFCASYEDLIAGRVPDEVKDSQYDAVILGWGSFSHVLNAADRSALLRVLKSLCRSGPVLLSFLTPPTTPAGRIERPRPNLRKLFRMLGAPAEASDGDAFQPGAGFVHLFTPEEVRALASEAGYRLLVADLAPYPHALLQPL